MERTGKKAETLRGIRPQPEAPPVAERSGSCCRGVPGAGRKR